MTNTNFCTCTDYNCQLHPANHGKGCTPCIAKNLKDNEIPSCFFIKAKGDISNVSDFSVENFARLVNEKQ